ncbi:MAG: energy coupling factor transporter S component ThiW [Synergistaceae bacterium]|jgi:energy coupling factor transporter S component ThiW|nr:energy coupling factor transporter S component ThiW [Synergistaceae bacterium]
MMNIFEIRTERDRLKKMALAGMFAAVAVLLSGFSFPVGPSRCFPFQHAMNVICGVILGPWWAVASAFVASAIRNLLGTGTVLAFPGSMFGALAVGLTADMLPRGHRLFAAAAEPFATSLVGAWVSSLIIMATAGKGAMFSMLSVAFLASSAPGAVIGLLALSSLSLAVKRGEAKAANGER